MNVYVACALVTGLPLAALASVLHYGRKPALSTVIDEPSWTQPADANVVIYEEAA